ncbi:helix-turn-helix domain-containing protein [Komagataeibacter oboediens]|uniref:helix-turn-helix domain-containing protein n=1 Tax=Komagataeibacter oboediens TaxID=65958 RepID=UPI001C2D56CB|nr:helix-turn-helix domain-containing protein [Komagataeibacter oboediens]MBV1824414.1 sigma-54-dependent Fis family transcriptional regulator [Komagataeibacter oboediens]
MLDGSRPVHPAFPIARIPAVQTGLDASWRRCQHDYGLDPSAPTLPDVLSGAELRQACQRAGRVLYSAGPELERLYAALAPVSYTVMLSDMDGIVLTHQAGPAIRRGCRRWHFWPGAVWAERHAGTNGIGTCLAEQRSISVHRNQHWRSGLHGLAGVATPVYDAYGRMAGALNASSFHPTPDGALGVLIASALLQSARQIELNCFMDQYRGHAIMLLGDTAGASVPLVALDRDRHIVGATHAARMQMGLSPTDDINVCLLDDTATPAPDAPLREAQTVAIHTALASARGKVAVAARMLGVSRSTLHRRIRNIAQTQATARP